MPPKLTDHRHTGKALGPSALGLALAALMATTLGCKEDAPCAKACARVAACKQKAQDGERMLGEKAPPPDKACMKKCCTRPDDFAKCEAKMRTCRELRPCHGPFR